MMLLQRRTIAVMIACFMFGILAGCTVYGGKRNTGWHATGGEALERQFWADVKARNVSELQKHMAMSWVFLTPDGPMDREATLEHIRQMNISDYTLGEFQVMPNGHDMVVTYTANVKLKSNGEDVQPVHLKMMTVWQKAERGWIAIAHADTRVPPHNADR